MEVVLIFVCLAQMIQEITPVHVIMGHNCIEMDMTALVGQWICMAHELIWSILHVLYGLYIGGAITVTPATQGSTNCTCRFKQYYRSIGNAGSCSAAGYVHSSCCTSGSCIGEPPNCYCDSVCHIFKDCCPDANTPYHTNNITSGNYYLYVCNALALKSCTMHRMNLFRHQR